MIDGQRLVWVNNPAAPFGDFSQMIVLNGWAVANAPRPLPGAVTWKGDHRHGVFYAAGPIGQFGQDWADLDGWPVKAITNMQITDRIAADARAADTTLGEMLANYEGDMSALAADCGYPWFQR